MGSVVLGIRHQPLATLASLDPSTKLPVNSTRFHSCLRAGDRPRLDPRGLLGSGDAFLPNFHHRRVHSFHECRDTPLLADTPAETPAWRAFFGRCWFQGFLRLVQGTCFRTPLSVFS